jgi:uncharacterized protein
MTITFLGMSALLVGVLIGTAGVGGVLLAPALILIGGIGPHQATALSLISFTLTGVVSVALHLRDSEFPRVLTRNLAIGLLPGAFIGGWLSGRIPDVIVLGALSGVSLFSALWTAVRFRAPAAGASEVSLGVRSGGPVGLAVGFGSAVTGTSGPVLLTPALMALRVPALRAIAVGQVVQVAVTPAGAFGSLLQTRPDLKLTAVLSAATAVGAAIGICGTRRLRLPDSFLYTVVTAALLATSVLVAIRLAGLL